MAAIFSFKCSCCGDLHEGSPSFSSQSPCPYATLSDAQKAAMGSLTSDLCTIEYEERTDYFVRAVLEVPIHGIEEPFLWGIWVSAGEKSFQRYVETYDAPVEGDGFFDWVCNRIEAYPTDRSRPSNVWIQINGQRPRVVLHRSENEVDLFVIDQAEGISIERAQQIAEVVLHSE